MGGFDQPLKVRSTGLLSAEQILAVYRNISKIFVLRSASDFLTMPSFKLSDRFFRQSL